MSYLQVMVSEHPRGEPSAIGWQVSELYCETPRPGLSRSIRLWLRSPQDHEVAVLAKYQGLQRDVDSH